MKNSFTVNYLKINSPSNDYFKLHSHKYYEIYMFLEGDCKYIVEGKEYKLDPYDIIIIRKSDMHRVYHNSSAQYRRIVFNIYPAFFEDAKCEEYERAFLHSEKGNKISASIVKSSGLYDAIMRIRKYTDNFKSIKKPVVTASLIEILHIINSVKIYTDADNPDDRVNAMISYINEHYTSNITLEELEKKFFVSKFHICHIFKQATGLTIHQYITQKRVMYARELENSGMLKGEAASMAGFLNYSSYYRAQKSIGLPLQL